MRLYADSAALAAYPGGADVPEGDVPALLRTASRMVDALLATRAYPVDGAGMPTDADHAQAMSDAVCAIVTFPEFRAAMRPDAAQQWEQVAIGSVKLAGRKSTPAATFALGLPVPAKALVDLSDVGRMVVTSW